MPGWWMQGGAQERGPLGSLEPHLNPPGWICRRRPTELPARWPLPLRKHPIDHLI